MNIHGGIPMYELYETKIRLTSSLCDRYKKVKLSSIIERFVDLTDEQTKLWEKYISLNNDNTGICWIINKYDVKIYSLPEYLSEVTLKTYQSRYTRHFCERIFALYDENGELLIRIVSYWSLRDFSAMKIVSVPEEYAQFTYTEWIAEKTDKKMAKNPQYTHTDPLCIRSDDFDTNMHVNNARYFSFLYECDDIMDYEKYELSEVLLNFVGGINDKAANTMMYALEDTGECVRLSQKILCADASTAAQIESYWRKK